MSPDQTAEVLRALADPQRLRLLALLVRHGTLCGCELEQITGIAQYTVSRSLNRMRRIGLVIATRNAARVDYQLPADLEPALAALVCATVATLADDAQIQADSMATGSVLGSSC